MGLNESSNAKPPSSKTKQAGMLIDKVIEESSKVFVFRIYEAKDCWFKQITDPVELRPHIGLAVRNERKRIAKEQNKAPAAPAASAITTATCKEKRQRQIICGGVIESDGTSSGDDASVMGLNSKRFKGNPDNCDCFGGGFLT